MRSYTAISGKKFNVEWYVDQSGHSQAYEYFDQLVPTQQDKILTLFKMMAE